MLELGVEYVDWLREILADIRKKNIQKSSKLYPELSGLHVSLDETEAHLADPQSPCWWRLLTKSTKSLERAGAWEGSGEVL